MRKHLFPVLLLANTLWSCLFAQTPIVMDMVHHNPGEPFTNTWFNEPGNLVPVSYTHLTLPTNREGANSIDAAAKQKKRGKV